MPNPSIDLSDKIPGWGSDLDLSKRPGVPRESDPHRPTEAYLQNVDRQTPHVKIFQTIERPELTPVFGTTCPPKGLSGMIRASAYELGEGRLARWLMLYFADRVDVVESAILDAFTSKKHGANARVSSDSIHRKLSHKADQKSALSKGTVAALGVGTLAVVSAILIRRRLHIDDSNRRLQ